MRTLVPDDKVLVLLPPDRKKLKWQGPFPVMKRCSPCDYVVKVQDGKEKIFHINFLKKYVGRQNTDIALPGFAVVSVGIAMGDSSSPDADVQTVDVKCVPTVQTETFRDVVINSKLSDDQRSALCSTFSKHSSYITDLPGSKDLVEFSFRLLADKVVHVKPYPLPFHSQQIVEKEVKKTLDMDVTEQSTSPFFLLQKSLVGKKNGVGPKGVPQQHRADCRTNKFGGRRSVPSFSSAVTCVVLVLSIFDQFRVHTTLTDQLIFCLT